MKRQRKDTTSGALAFTFTASNMASARKSALETIFSGEELPSPASASDVIKSGWLTKRSVTAPGPFKNWRRRYIVLKQHVIIWQHNHDDLRDFAAGGATRALTFGSNVSI